MRYLIVGGVAAGTKAAAKLKRCDRSAEVVVATKSEDISYAGCGLPYYIGGDIQTRGELIVNTPESYAGLTGVTVRTGQEATALNATITLRRRSCFVSRARTPQISGIPIIPYNNHSAIFLLSFCYYGFI